jgi:N-acetylmuramoyl-L-alanine amidase
MSGGNYNALRERRLGVMLHYDASTGSDKSAIGWFSDPDCEVSYNLLVGDDGHVYAIAPEDRRAWHAGVCKSSDPRLAYKDANSAFYGISWAGGGRKGDRCPEAAKASIVSECVRLFRKHGWSADETWRIVGHRTEAWPRGRKTDPEGADLKNPVLSTEEIRRRVRTRLQELGTVRKAA